MSRSILLIRKQNENSLNPVVDCGANLLEWQFLMLMSDVTSKDLKMSSSVLS